MVSNEKYTGDAILQKTYTDEHFNHHHNYGEKDQYLVKNHHEAIISHEVFETAQMVINQRGKEKGVKKYDYKYQNRYPLSGKIICGQCGGTFKRRIHLNGKQYIAWCCTIHIANITKCSLKYIPEIEFEYAFVTMINKLIFGHETVLKPLLMNLRGINSDDSLKSIREFNKKLEENAEQRKVLVCLMTIGYLEPVVKRIYREYLEGVSMLKIARGLEADGLLNGAGKEKWHTNNIIQILRNEKYIGNAILLNNIETVLSHENDTTLADIDKRLAELQTELLKLANSKLDYEDVADAIYRLREHKQKVQVEAQGGMSCENASQIWVLL